MDKVFKDQIGRNLKVDVDDMLIKSKSLDDHLIYLQVNFIIMQSDKVKINPTKCTFRVTVGKFLGVMLFERGIEVNPSKHKAILEIRSPTTVNEVQRLNGCIIALS